MTEKAKAKFLKKTLLATPVGAYRIDHLPHSQLYYGVDESGLRLMHVNGFKSYERIHRCVVINIESLVGGEIYRSYLVTTPYTQLWSADSNTWRRADDFGPGHYLGGVLIDHINNDGGIALKVSGVAYETHHVVSLDAPSEVACIALKDDGKFLHTILVKV
jgi:hypothetical protein